MCFEQGVTAAGGGGGAHSDGITLQVIGGDGTLWGQPFAFQTNLRNIGGVDSGWNGHDIVVVWWSAALVPNQMYSQRVAPTFL